MASSRNPRPKLDPADAALLEALRRALTAGPPTLALPAAAPPSQPLIIAFSGGADSTVLLDLAWRLRAERATGFAELRAVHVNHGLQAAADDWAEHCRAQCAARHIGCDIVRVRVAAERGLEDGARSARYAALRAAALACGAGAVLTAHHADDRIETFLLQWLRGAGPAGLASMAPRRALTAAAALLRPLLDCPRHQLLDYARRHRLVWVEDPSNADPSHARNALRLQVLPPLARIRSGYRAAALRSIELVGEAAELLQELAQEGLEACSAAAPAAALRLDRLALLAPRRRALVLRAWLAAAGLPALPRQHLAQLLHQALDGGRAGRMLIRIGAHEVRRQDGLLRLRKSQPLPYPPVQLHWQGETQLVVPAWGGALHFLLDAAVGFDPQWLRARPLQLRPRAGGERLKPHPARPSRRLKQLFQEAGIAEFARRTLPLLWRDHQLIYVAGLGADTRLMEQGAGRVRLQWQDHGREGGERLEENAPPQSALPTL